MKVFVKFAAIAMCLFSALGLKSQVDSFRQYKGLVCLNIGASMDAVNIFTPNTNPNANLNYNVFLGINTGDDAFIGVSSSSLNLTRDSRIIFYGLTMSCPTSREKNPFILSATIGSLYHNIKTIPGQQDLASLNPMASFRVDKIVCGIGGKSDFSIFIDTKLFTLPSVSVSGRYLVQNDVSLNYSLGIGVSININ
jgi:hypothetical protein